MDTHTNATPAEAEFRQHWAENERIFDFDLAMGVDQIFQEAEDRHEDYRINPVVDGFWDADEEPVGPQKRAAYRALLARRWWEQVGPSGHQPLPLSQRERALMSTSPNGRVLALFARSLEACDFDYSVHPSFEEYVGGLLALDAAYFSPLLDDELRRRCPPRPLKGLGSVYYIWRRPE
jgi:hypothetical protein